MNAAGNPTVWRAVMGQDADSLRDFYRGLLGSRFRPRRGDRGPGPRTLRHRAPVAALEGTPASFTPVHDLESAVILAQRLGSRILTPITEQGGQRIAVLSDADGRPVGLCGSGAPGTPLQSSV